MKCIIEIDESGNCVNHPILLDNFLEAFPETDLSGDNPPEGYAWFVRKIYSPKTFFPDGIPEGYKKDERYIKTSDNTFEDDFYLRPMTQEEKDIRYESFLRRKPFPSWVADSENKKWNPPVPAPQDGNRYYWDEETISWIKLEE